LIYVKPTIFNK